MFCQFAFSFFYLCFANLCYFNWFVFCHLCLDFVICVLLICVLLICVLLICVFQICVLKTQMCVFQKHKSQIYKPKGTPKIVRAAKHKCGFCQNTHEWVFRRPWVLNLEIPRSDEVKRSEPALSMCRSEPF